jgi:hypothetical protein
MPESLTDLQVAAALSEQSYRRDGLDQQLQGTDSGFGAVQVPICPASSKEMSTTSLSSRPT